MKDLKRALRRHHAARLWVKRRLWLPADLRDSERHIGKRLATAKPCSCWMCGHRREHLGPTLQELKGNERMDDDES